MTWLRSWSFSWVLVFILLLNLISHSFDIYAYTFSSGKRKKNTGSWGKVVPRLNLPQISFSFFKKNKSPQLDTPLQQVKKMSIGVFEWKSIKLTCNDNFETNVNTNRHLNLLQQVHIFQRLFVIIWINSAPLSFGWINLMVKHYLHPLSWDQVCWWSRIEKKSQRYQFCHAYEGCLKFNLYVKRYTFVTA